MEPKFINEKFSKWYDTHSLYYGGLFHKTRGTYRLPNFLTSALEFIQEENIELGIYDKTLFTSNILSQIANAAPNANKMSWASKFNNREEFKKAYFDFFNFIKDNFKVPLNKIKDTYQAEFMQISYRYLDSDIETFLNNYTLLNKASKNILAEKFFSSFNPFSADGHNLYNNEEDFYFYKKHNNGYTNFYDDEDKNKDKWESYSIDQNKLNEEVQRFEKVFSFKPTKDFMEKIVSNTISDKFTKRGALMIIYLKNHHNYILTDNQTKKLLVNLEYFDSRIGELIIDTQIYNHTIVKYKNSEKALKILGVSADKYENVYKDKLTIYLEKLKLENLFTSLEDSKPKETISDINKKNESQIEVEIVEEVKPKKKNKI